MAKLGTLTPLLPTPSRVSQGSISHPRPQPGPRGGTPLLPTPKVQKRSYGRLALLR